MRVRASSLNYRDLMVLKGGGRGPTKLGVVPLSDGAGEVAAIGDGVTRVKIGDRIAGCFHPRWFGGPIKPDYLTDRLGANLEGMLAEYAVLSEEALVHVPSHLSFEEAARSDGLGRIDGQSPGYRRRHGLDAGFGETDPIEVDQRRPFVTDSIPQRRTCVRMRNPSSGCGGAKYTVTRWNISSVT